MVAVTAERDELQGLVQQAAAEMAAVQAQVAEGSAAQAGLKAEAERVGAQLAELTQQLEAEQSARSAAEREAKDKADRLERLEGACVGVCGLMMLRWRQGWWPCVMNCWLLNHGNGWLGVAAGEAAARHPARPAHCGPACLCHDRWPRRPNEQVSWRRCRSAPSAWARATRRRC